MPTDALAAYDRVLLIFLGSMVACWAVLLLLYPRRERAASK